MRSLLVLVLVLSSASLAAAPKCVDRVKALKTLGEQAEAKARANAAGVVQLSYFPSDESLIERLETREGWKARGVRLMAPPDAEFSAGDQAAVVKHLAALAKETKVELCVQLEAPIEQKLSLDADAKLLAPMLKSAASVEARDRATVLASELSKKGKCKGIPKLATAIANAAPADRLHLLLLSAAEALEECKCPAADGERAYAVLTLMADVWDAKTTCTPLVLGKPDTAKPVVASGKLTDFVARIAAAGEAGVELKAK